MTGQSMFPSSLFIRQKWGSTTTYQNICIKVPPSFFTTAILAWSQRQDSFSFSLSLYCNCSHHDLIWYAKKYNYFSTISTAIWSVPFSLLSYCFNLMKTIGQTEMAKPQYFTSFSSFGLVTEKQSWQLN